MSTSASFSGLYRPYSSSISRRAALADVCEGAAAGAVPTGNALWPPASIAAAASTLPLGWDPNRSLRSRAASAEVYGPVLDGAHYRRFCGYLPFANGAEACAYTGPTSPSRCPLLTRGAHAAHLHLVRGQQSLRLRQIVLFHPLALQRCPANCNSSWHTGARCTVPPPGARQWTTGRTLSVVGRALRPPPARCPPPTSGGQPAPRPASTAG